MKTDAGKASDALARPFWTPRRVTMGETQRCVYFIQNGDDGAIKIGMTRKLHKRLAHLQVNNPIELCVLGAIPTNKPRDLERDLHRKFSESRVSGEWFSPSEELLDFIKYHVPEVHHPDDDVEHIADFVPQSHGLCVICKDRYAGHGDGTVCAHCAKTLPPHPSGRI